MEHSEAIALLAQAIVNIDEGVKVIEQGSRIYNAMVHIVKNAPVFEREV